MASKFDRQIQDAIKKISNLDEKLFSSKNMSELGAKLKDQIFKRTRVAGKGVSEDGSLRKFDPLSERYVEFKKRNSENLGQGASPKKSNVSATGQMLDSMDYQAKKFEIIFKLVGSRSRELGGGQPKHTNAEIAGFLLDRYNKNLPGGRRFFALSDADKKTAKRFFQEKLRELLDANKG